MIPDAPPIFVVGMPRSGTKLLRDLLNRHPLIAIPDAETEFLPLLVRRIGACGDVSDLAAFRRMCRELFRSPFFEHRREQGRPIDVQGWHRLCRTFDAAGVFEALIRLDTGAARGSGRIWGDKSPSYIDDIALLDSLFPGVRVLHIVRDVRDYCVSIHHAWGKDRLRAAQRWADGVVAARWAGSALGERYMELRYEDLLEDPTLSMKKICGVLRIDFVPEMITLARPSENIGRAKGSSRIESGNSGGFVTRLPPPLTRKIERLAGRSMYEFGYGLSHPPQAIIRLSPQRLWIAKLSDAVHLTLRTGRQKGLFKAVKLHWNYSKVIKD